jgi:hypothetical protein
MFKIKRTSFKVAAQVYLTDDFEEIKIKKKGSDILVNGQPAQMTFDGFKLIFKAGGKTYFVFDENTPKDITVSKIYRALK